MPIQQLPVQSQLPPDLAGQLAQIQMRQQLSQALLGQSMQPINPARSSGRYIIPISPLEGLSHLTTSALLSKGLIDATKDSSSIYSAANERRNEASDRAWLGGGSGQPQTTYETDPNGAPGVNVVPGSETSAPMHRGVETPQEIYRQARIVAPAYGIDVNTLLGEGAWKVRLEAALADTKRTDLQKNFADPSLKDWQDKELTTLVRDNSVLTRGGKVVLNNPTPGPGTYNTWKPGDPNPSANVAIPGAQQNMGDINYQKLYQDAMAKLEMMKTAEGQTKVKTQAQLANLPQPANWQRPDAVQTNAAPPAAPAVPAMPFATPQAPPPGITAPNAVRTQVPQNAGQIAPPVPLSNAAPLAQKAFPWQQAKQQQKEPGVYGPTITSQEEQSTRGKDLAAQMQTIDTAANSAATVQSRIGEMRDLLKNFTPGVATPWKEKLGAVAVAAGMKPDGHILKSIGAANPGDMQAFGKIALNLAFEQTKQLTNRPAASEVMLALKANPNLALTPQGIGKIMDYMDAMSAYQLAKQQTAQSWKTAPGGPKSLEGFDAWFNKEYKILGFMPKDQPKTPQPAGALSSSGSNVIRWDQLQR